MILKMLGSHLSPPSILIELGVFPAQSKSGPRLPKQTVGRMYASRQNGFAPLPSGNDRRVLKAWQALRKWKHIAGGWL